MLKISDTDRYSLDTYFSTSSSYKIFVSLTIVGIIVFFIYWWVGVLIVCVCGFLAYCVKVAQMPQHEYNSICRDTAKMLTELGLKEATINKEELITEPQVIVSPRIVKAGDAISLTKVDANGYLRYSLSDYSIFFLKKNSLCLFRAMYDSFDCIVYKTSIKDFDYGNIEFIGTLHQPIAVENDCDFVQLNNAYILKLKIKSGEEINIVLDDPLILSKYGNGKKCSMDQRSNEKAIDNIKQTVKSNL